MPATRKTRKQQNAVKEDTKETTPAEDQQPEDETVEDAKRPRRTTRSAQKVAAKNQKKNDQDDEENESSKEGDEMSEDRTRTRRVRRGKTDKEVVTAETNEKDEIDEDESEQQDIPSTKGTRVSKQRNNTASKRSKTPTSEAESGDAPPGPRKTRASLAGTRQNKASKGETANSDNAKTEEEGNEKEDEKSENSGSESQDESKSRIRRATRSKRRKSQVSKEEVVSLNDLIAKDADDARISTSVDGEAPDESEPRIKKREPSRAKPSIPPSTRETVTNDSRNTEEKSDEKEKKAEDQTEDSGGESQNESSSRTTRASRSKTRRSQVSKEEVVPLNDETKKDAEDARMAENTGGEAPNESEARIKKGEPSRAVMPIPKIETVTIDGSNTEVKSDAKEKRTEDKSQDSGGESENESLPRATRASLLKTRKSQIPTEQIAQNDESVKEVVEAQMAKVTSVKASGECILEVEKREPVHAATVLRSKAKVVASLRNSIAKKQEEEASQKHKSSKQLELYDFLKPKEDADAGKQDGDDPSEKPNDKESNEVQSLIETCEDAQEDIDRQGFRSIEPTDKAHKPQIEEGPVDREKVDNGDRNQIVAESKAREASTLPEKGKLGEPDTIETMTMSGKKDHSCKVDAEEAVNHTDDSNLKRQSMLGNDCKSGGFIAKVIKATSDGKKETDKHDEEAPTVTDMTDQAGGTDATELSMHDGLNKLAEIATSVAGEKSKEVAMDVEDTIPMAKDTERGHVMDTADFSSSRDGENDAGKVEAGGTLGDLGKEHEDGSLHVSSEQLVEADKDSDKVATIEKNGLERHDDDLSRLRSNELCEGSLLTENFEVLQSVSSAFPHSRNEQRLPSPETSGEATARAEDENSKMRDDDNESGKTTTGIGKKDDTTENLLSDMKEHLSTQALAGNLDEAAVCGPVNDSTTEPKLSESMDGAELNDRSVDLHQSGSNENRENAGVLTTGESTWGTSHSIEGSQEKPNAPLNLHSSDHVEDILVVGSDDKDTTSAAANSDRSSATIHVGISGPAEIASVSVEIAPELIIPSSGNATQVGVNVDEDNCTSIQYQEVSQLHALDAADADGSENKKRSMDDDDDLDDAVVKRQRIDDQGAVDFEFEEPKKYINLRCIKMRLFSTGSRVHGRMGYEKLFRDYWNSIALYLDSRLPISYTKVCKKIIDRFLRTKSLRRLHNKLIMDLIDRSLDEKIPAHLVDLQGIPDDIRARIRPIVRRRTHNRDVLPINIKKLETEFKSALSMRSAPTQHAPLISFPSKPPNGQQIITRNSASIPGALIVDPYMRKNAQSLGMMVSENAIWLVTIAMKEYTSQLLRNLVASSKLLNQGQVPPISVNRLTPVKKKGQETPKVEDRPLPYDTSREVQCLTAFDVHLFTAGMPIGPVGAMGGYSSRLTYERSLDTCVGEGYTLSAFDDLKQFITSSLESSIVDRKIPNRRSPASVSPSSDRRSPYGGLGRGAKDLAALKARASQKTQPSQHANHSSSQNYEAQMHPPQQQEQTGIKSAVTEQLQQVIVPQHQQPAAHQQQQRPIFNQQQRHQTITDQQQQAYTAQQQQLQRQMMQQRLQQSQQHALAQPQQYIPSEGSQKGKNKAVKSSSPPKNTRQMQPSPTQASQLIRQSSQQMQPSPPQMQPKQSQLIRQSSQQMQPSPPQMLPQPSQLIRQSSQQLQPSLPQLMPQPSQLTRQSSQQMQPSPLVRQSSQQLQSSPPQLQPQSSQLMRQSSQNATIQGQPIPSSQLFPIPTIQGQPLSPQQQQQMQMQLQMQQQMMQQQIQQRDPHVPGQMGSQAQVPPQQLQQQQQMQMQMQQQMMQMQYMQAMQAQAQQQQPSTSVPTQPLVVPQAVSQSATLQQQQSDAQPPQQQVSRPPSAAGGKGFGIKNLKAMLARSVPANEENNITSDTQPRDASEENPARAEANSTAATPEDSSTRSDEIPKHPM